MPSIPPADAAQGSAEVRDHGPAAAVLPRGRVSYCRVQQDERTKQDYLRAYYDSIVYRDIVRANVVRNQKALARAPPVSPHKHCRPILVPPP